MRIGIHPALKRSDGGIYQYSVTMLNALLDLSQRSTSFASDEFVVLAHDTSDAALAGCASAAWDVRTFRPPWSPQGLNETTVPKEPFAPREQADMRSWLTECGIDLMLYPSPHRLSFESSIPFVMAIHDLQHRMQPKFPEVSAGGEWERREYLFRNAAQTATMLIAESEVGRDDIVSCYARHGVTADRIAVLSYLPACGTNSADAAQWHTCVRRKFALPDRYLFYPAQFWPHKNHLRLIEALGILRREHDLAIPLVLAGASTGELREEVCAQTRARAGELGIQDQAIFLGYVSDAEVAGLYTGAVGLTMPTFFGPTNIPFLEAWSHGCPVLTSNIRGIVEQVGPAAITVDPRDAKDIAEGIRRLWTDDALRRTLIALGQERLKSYTYDDYCERLTAILEESKNRVAHAPRALQRVH